MPYTEDIKEKVSGKKSIDGKDAIRMLEAVEREKNELEEQIRTLQESAGTASTPRRYKTL